MKHQNQKRYECFPTVLGMLLDIPAKQVIRDILGKQLAKQSWSYLISNSSSESYACLREQVRAYLADRLPWLSIQAFDTEQAKQACSIPARGRGIAVINSHIVAFEQGLVFDPAKLAPMPLAAYMLDIRAHNKVIKLVEEEK